MAKKNSTDHYQPLLGNYIQKFSEIMHQKCWTFRNRREHSFNMWGIWTPTRVLPYSRQNVGICSVQNWKVIKKHYYYPDFDTGHSNWNQKFKATQLQFVSNNWYKKERMRVEKVIYCVMCVFSISYILYMHQWCEQRKGKTSRNWLSCWLCRR